ncbi:MAG TPA: N-acetylmuramoyl-L-alanine amidase [Chitinophagales bacterium]|nr:N-acetylmuramoyl-L-alanine amidase [Chitinophagales bacterium]
MKKLYALCFSVLCCGSLFAQPKCDSVFINGELHLQRDVSHELRIVESHIDKDVQPHSHELWAYYLSKPHPSGSVVEKYFNDAALEFNVPVALLKTIGQIENNWTQTGPSIDQGWGIMHLVQNDYCNTLGEAAQLLGVSEQLLKDDARQNIRGAAALLQSYYNTLQPVVQKDGLETWYPAVKKFTGLISDELRTIQADRYYGVMCDGAHSTTLWNEEIVLPRDPKLDMAFINANYHHAAEDDASRSSDYGPAVSSMTTCNYSSGRNHSIDTWVNHWIGTGTAAGAVSWFQNCSANASAHFVTANNGTIYQVVPVANTAWHCGASGYPYNNGRSIGQEHEATNANPGLWNSTAMLQASANMACYFCTQYGIATNQNNTSPGICGHQNMPGTNTDCPGTIPWSTWFNYFNSGTCSAVVVVPTNDYCGNETNLTVYGATCGAATTGNLSGATQSTAPIACGGYTSTLAKDVWFKFVATSTAHTITVVPTGGLDAVVDLRSGCPGTSIACADDGGGEGATEVLQATGLTVGATYNVRVYDYTGANNPPTTTTFTICVTTPCTAPVKPVITGTQTVCAGQSTTLTVSNTCSGCTYSWSNGGTGTQISVSASGTYRVTATNSCATVASDAYGVTVTPAVTPTVAISTPNASVCAGASVTFTATATSGGSTPVYQWTKNSVNIGGANAATYSSSSLSTNDTIRVRMTSNAACATTATVTSNAIVLTVNQVVTPTVSIAANPAGSVCAGDNVTFTATVTNGGASPVYTWRVNGNVVGGNANSYSSSSLPPTNNVVSCTLQSAALCATPAVVADTIDFIVYPLLTPFVYISTGSGSSICNGQTTSFYASSSNGGTGPLYQWRVNGITVATGDTFTTSALSNGDIVRCHLTTSLTGCLVDDTALSNAFLMNVSGSVTPAISISTTSSTICSADPVTFIANANGGGTTPGFVWKKNGNPINGANASTYTGGNFATGDVITCQLTSSATCATTSTANSNSITLTVTPTVVPLVGIVANPSGAVCAGEPVTFATSVINGGANPVYQWWKNGFPILSATGPSFISDSLAAGDTITCSIVSTHACPSVHFVESNQIVVDITQPLLPAVSIISSQSDSVCAGTSIMFTAQPVNGGVAPAWQWKVNGSNAATGISFVTTQLTNGDVVTCQMTTNGGCVVGGTYTSNEIAANIIAPAMPVVSITSNVGLVTCAGTAVTFTATAINEGNAPVYEWKVNGVVTGSGNTYSTSSLANGDVVTCALASSQECIASATVQSNALQMQVGGNVTPAVQVNDCELAASFIPNVSYQWYGNNSLLSGAITRFYTAAQTGYYYVMVADSNFCTTQSADVFVSYPACLATSVQDLNIGGFSVYEISPGHWQVTAQSNIAYYDVEVLDALGRSVYMARAEGAKHIIDKRLLAGSIYLVRIKSPDMQYFVKKIVGF